MCLTLVFCVILVASFSFGPTIAGEAAVKRLKRGGPTIQAVKAGLRAALQLLHGAREKGINRLYVKNGGYSRATKDFYSVNPKYVESSVTEQGQRIKIGTAGDRRLKLVEGQGHQSTLLEIATKGNAHRDFTILYKP